MASKSISELPEVAVTLGERYERGLALKNAGLHKAAIDQFQLAVVDPDFALKAHAQIGLCYKLTGHFEQAIAAFQNALKASRGSSKETVQVLYVLGRTLESLGRVEETLEAYRWIRREDPGYRDVADRIATLCVRRLGSVGKRDRGEDTSWTDSVRRSWQGLMGNPR